ncbi:MAG TPA: VWA domain-containing protein [Terriglobales bacterium]|jgi:Ca-activated chloride channel family protein|nr:VWA domain-containing protein [Terriglobales bacterium]
MLLRNSRVLPLVLTVLTFLHSALLAQEPGAANQPAAESPQSSSQPSKGQGGQISTPPPEAAPSPNQKDSSQDNQSQANHTQQSQDQGQTGDNGVFVFKKQVEEVMLHATVMDDKNHLVTNLDKGAFTVFENNQPQTITSFRHEDIPVAMGIVIDNSGSMREKRDKVNKAALNLVRSSNPQDQVFVVNFNDEYYLDQPFTSDINKLREALEKVEARGGTALYDAIVASADYMKKNAKLQKKVLFVVTDGEDNASRESLEEAVRRLQEENGPTVYAIGLLGEEKARRARRALETIAQRTGGIAFLPRTLDEVDQISSSVAHDIRNQYTIGYKPTTPKSAGGYRAIRVEAHAKGYGKLVVRTRSGYYPGQETGPS